MEAKGKSKGIASSAEAYTICDESGDAMLFKRLMALANQIIAEAHSIAANRGYGDRIAEVPFMLAGAQTKFVSPEQFDATALSDQIWKFRRRRESLFADDNLFGEPAWDILLDLHRNAHSGREISVTSACIGAATPLTTALRWLTVLESKGLVQRTNDRTDSRRSFVSLTQKGTDLMNRLLKRGIAP